MLIFFLAVSFIILISYFCRVNEKDIKDVINEMHISILTFLRIQQAVVVIGYFKALFQRTTVILLLNLFLFVLINWELSTGVRPPMSKYDTNRIVRAIC